MTLAELYPDLRDRLAHQPVGRPLVVKRHGAWLALRYAGAGQTEAAWHTNHRAALDEARRLSRLPTVTTWALPARG